jgi:hypothetical protein
MLVMLLAACDTAAPPAPRVGQGGMDAAVLDACRQRANEIYDRQNRAAIYAPQSGVNSPLSGNYVESALTRGLSSQFAHEQLIRECIRTANVTSGRGEVPIEGAGSAAPPPPPPDIRR